MESPLLSRYFSLNSPVDSCNESWQLVTIRLPAQLKGLCTRVQTAQSNLANGQGYSSQPCLRPYDPPNDGIFGQHPRIVWLHPPGSLVLGRPRPGSSREPLVGHAHPHHPESPKLVCTQSLPHPSGLVGDTSVPSSNRHSPVRLDFLLRTVALVGNTLRPHQNLSNTRELYLWFAKNGNEVRERCLNPFRRIAGNPPLLQPPFETHQEAKGRGISTRKFLRDSQRRVY